MAEQLETTSLAGLANRKKSAPVRSDSTDSAAKAGARDAARRDGFDGFLKTFLGKDKAANGNGAATSRQPARSGLAAVETSRSKSTKKNGGAGNPSWTGPEVKKKTERLKDGEDRHAKAASRLSPREKRALRRALEKTVPADNPQVEPPLAEPLPPAAAYPGAWPAGGDFAAGADGAPREGLEGIEEGMAGEEPAGGAPMPAPEPAVDPEVAAAAEEAARIIWNILYPDAEAGGEVGAGPESGNAAFSALAEAVRAFRQAGRGEGADGLAELGAAGLDPEAVGDALETANASAEMNIDAVLAALEDLLDGMPREALEKALAKTASELGLPAEGGEGGQFQELAEALGLEIVGSDAVSVPVDSTVLLEVLARNAGGRSAATPSPVPEATPEIAADGMTEASAEPIPEALPEVLSEALPAASETVAEAASGVLPELKPEAGEPVEGQGAEAASAKAAALAPASEESEGVETQAVSDPAEVEASPAAAASRGKDAGEHARHAEAAEGEQAGQAGGSRSRQAVDKIGMAAAEQGATQVEEAVPTEEEPIINRAHQSLVGETEMDESVAAAERSASPAAVSPSAPVAAPAEQPAEADAAGIPEVSGGENATGEIGRQNEAAETAEIAASQKGETEIYGLFQQFLEEKGEEIFSEWPITLDETLDPDTAEELVNAFANWLLEGDNSNEMKALSKDWRALALALGLAAAKADASGAAPTQSEKQKIFSRLATNVESLLQSSNDKTAQQDDAEADAIEPAQLEGEGNEIPGPAVDSSRRDGGGQRDGGSQPVAGSQGMEAPAATQSAQTVRTSQNGAAAMLDRIENIERLADAMRMANRNGVKNLTLALSPAELGKVLLRVESRNGLVSAYLRVETPEAASQLSSGLAQLRENLRVQGIELGELDIRHQHQGQATGDGDQRQKRNREADGDAPAARGAAIDGLADEDAQEAERVSSRGSGGRGSLNLFA